MELRYIALFIKSIKQGLLKLVLQNLISQMARMTSTLYDLMLKQPGLTNLKMGAPDEATLRKCARIFSEATEHRLVTLLAHLLVINIMAELSCRPKQTRTCCFSTDQWRGTVASEWLSLNFCPTSIEVLLNREQCTGATFFFFFLFVLLLLIRSKTYTISTM